VSRDRLTAGKAFLSRSASIAVMLQIALAVATAVSVAASHTTRSQFPPSIYPPPASFPHWGLPIGCPSLKGVTTLSHPDPRPLLTMLGRFDRVSELSDLRDSDRALWRLVRRDWRSARPRRGPVHLSRRDVVFGPGRQSAYAAGVSRNCGRRTLAVSWSVAVCPFNPNRVRPCSLREAPALTSHTLFVRRRGHWLIWFAYP
jgi:hypothetical protein